MRWISACAASVLLLGCTDETIVLATLPGEDAGTMTAPPRCAGDSDCPSGTFCAKPSCSSPGGTCELFPAECTDDEAPVCGCDGITYFNDCLRLAAGVAASTSGSCQFGGVPCGGPGNLQCPTGSSCARLLGFQPGPCPADVRGTCWVLPLTCPQPTHPDHWNTCGSGAKCIDTCTAIRSQEIYRRSTQCP